MNYLYFILFVLSIVVIYVKFKTVFVPPTIVSVSWLFFPSLIASGFFDAFQIESFTHLVILFSFFSYFLVFLLDIKIPFTSREPSDNNDESNHYFNFWLIISVNIIILLWLLTHLQTALSLISSNGLHFLRANAQETFSESTQVNIVYVWFAQPFIIASLIIVSYSFFHIKDYKLYLLIALVLINIVLDSLIFAARASLVKFILYFALSFLFCHYRKTKMLNRYFLFILVLAVILFINYITKERNEASNIEFGFTYTLGVYYILPFSLLNQYILHPGFSNLGFENYLYGKGLFGFIYNIYRAFMYIVFKEQYNGSDYINQQVTQEFLYVTPSIKVNAECTAAYIFLRDLGLFGVVLGFSLVAFFCNSIYSLYNSKPSVRHGALYLYSLHLSLRLLSTYDMLNPSAFFTILFIILCTIKFNKNSIVEKPVLT